MTENINPNGVQAPQPVNDPNLKPCKTCGTPIAKNAKVCPSCGAKIKKPFYKKPIIWILAIVIIIIIGAAAGSGDDVKDSGTDNNTTAVETTEVKTSYKKGESVTINDEVKITLTDCDTNWTGYDTYEKPESGMKYVQAKLTFENVGDTDVSLDTLDCYADDTSYDLAFVSGIKSPTLESISSGKKFNAVVVYEVPKDSKNVILQYETSYFSSKYVEFQLK